MILKLNSSSYCFDTVTELVFKINNVTVCTTLIVSPFGYKCIIVCQLKSYFHNGNYKVGFCKTIEIGVHGNKLNEND